MKKLDLPETDDQGVLKDICNNSRLRCNPCILNEYLTMRDQYSSYTDNKGNPWLCQSINLDVNLVEALKYHYKKPSKDFSYITELRRSGSADICPMCGSLKTADLDHFLPQADYPEWVVFSRNLVPACDCNRTRRNDVKGDTPDERVLHPYFDACLSNRLISCIFKGDLNLPLISLVRQSHPSVADITIDFHINTVIKRSTIISWLGAKWLSLKRCPSAIIGRLPRRREVNRDALVEAIQDCLEDKDIELSSKNNWYSIFYHGISLDDDVIDWILDRHNGIVRGDIDPLAND